MPEHNRRSTDHLEQRLEFETLLSDLSSRFINIPPREVDREILDAQRQICQFLGLDMSSLWQLSPSGSGMLLTHLFRTVEDPPTPEHMASTEFFPWLHGRVLRGLTTSFVSLSELPPEAAVDRASSESNRIRSSLIIPLAAGGDAPFGGLTFSATKEERDWPAELVNRLHLVAQVFANAIARRRADNILQEREQRMMMAADAADAGLWTLDLATGEYWGTERAYRNIGHTPGDAITRARIDALIHPDDLERVRAARAVVLQEGRYAEMEYRLVRPDGRVRWIASRGRPKLDSNGKPVALMGLSIDITERKIAEEEHRMSAARLGAGAEIAGLAYYKLDFRDGVAFVDERFREICGIPLELQGLQTLKYWLEHVHPDDRERVLQRREELRAGVLDRVSLEYRYLHSVDGEKWIHHVAGAARRDSLGRATATFGVIRDITDARRTEEALRDLSQRLIRAHEEERAVLARELHDDVTQRLAVLAIDVGRVEGDAAGTAQAETMRGIREALVRLSEGIHTLAYQLHPSVLDELGLREALRTEVERFGRRSGVALSLGIDDVPDGLGKDAALCLFRVAQEALNNVTRHAGARSASVSLRQLDGGLILSVRDDGAGFDAQNSDKKRSLGLASMRERVRLVDGTLDIESAPGRGTSVTACVPLEGES
jgi:PAS domain S-box-containing protein